jgi:POT family proton-dependent oligopeptide transporter
MTFALIQYVVGRKHLEGAGELKEDFATVESVTEARSKLIKAVGVLVGVIGLLVLLGVTGVLPATLTDFAQATGVTLVILSILYFAYVIAFVCRDNVERSRVGVCALLFLGAAMFWSGFEQAGSSMNIFAKDFTDRVIFGRELTAGALQMINPTFIILLAPVMGMLWVKLASRSPSIPAKFGYGLVLLGAGFLVLAWGSTYVGEGSRVGMQWLVVTYFLHTVGELCLSPVGLSSITKLAPSRLVGQMMGTWFMGAALGNLIAGLVTGYIEKMPLPQLFGTVATIVAVCGFLFLILAKPIRKMTHGID